MVDEAAPPLTDDRFRVTTWHVDPAVAIVSVRHGTPEPTTERVRDLTARLRDGGYRRITTAALRSHEAAAFGAAGFDERERLAVLSHDLRSVPAAPLHKTRRGRRLDRTAVIEVDHAAFQPEWQLDRTGLRDAIAATPRARFRVAGGGTAVVAYAVTGRAGRTGFIQRLAVHPDHTSTGLGSSLVIDALMWLRDRATLAMVNTQLSNERALALYSGLGFAREPSELSVLTLQL